MHAQIKRTHVVESDGKEYIEHSNSVMDALKLDADITELGFF